MIYCITYTIIWILSILGIIKLFEFILKWIYFAKTYDTTSEIIIIELKENYEKLEYETRRINVLNTSTNSNFNILCINSGTNNEIKKICNLLSRNFNCITILDN